MHTPTVLSICAALLLFMLNSAYGTPAQGMLDKKLVFTVSTDTKGNVVIDSEIGIDQDFENTDAATGSDESAKESTDIAKEDTDTAKEDTNTEKPDSLPAVPQHETQASIDDATPATTSESRPTVVDDAHRQIWNFYRGRNRLTISPHEGPGNAMEIQDGVGNTVLLQIEEESEGPGENPGSPEERTFFSRLVENLNDEENGMNDQTRAFVTTFLTFELLDQYQSMTRQGKVTPYSLRRLESTSKIHALLGRCFNSYSGLAQYALEIWVPLGNGELTHSYPENTFSTGGENPNSVTLHSSLNRPIHHRAVKATFVIPFSSNAYKLGITEYCSDGKNDGIQKKDDSDDDENPGGNRVYKFGKWILSATPVLNRLVQKTEAGSTEKSPPSSEGDKKTNKIMLLADLHKSLTDNLYGYPSTDESLLTIQSEIKVNQWFNTGLKSQILNPVSHHLNPATQAPQPQSIMGF